MLQLFAGGKAANFSGKKWNIDMTSVDHQYQISVWLSLEA